MLALPFDRADALHLAIALDFHDRNLPHGVALPAGLEQLRVHAWTVAKGDSDGQDTTAIDEFVELLQAARVERLAYSEADVKVNSIRQFGRARFLRAFVASTNREPCRSPALERGGRAGRAFGAR